MTTGPRAPSLGSELDECDDPTLADDDVVEQRTVTGDVGASEATGVELIGSLFLNARLTGIELPTLVIRDCRFEGCEMSGVLLDGARLTRVEFIDCRLSGAVLSNARLKDVRVERCRTDGAMFRMSTFETCEFSQCDLTGAEFYESTIGQVSFLDGDLHRADFTGARLEDVRLHGSVLTDLRGGASMRGAIIDADQLVPMGLIALDALGVVIGDRPEPSPPPHD